MVYNHEWLVGIMTLVDYWIKVHLELSNSIFKETNTKLKSLVLVSTSYLHKFIENPKLYVRGSKRRDMSDRSGRDVLFD